MKLLYGSFPLVLSWQLVIGLLCFSKSWTLGIQKISAWAALISPLVPWVSSELLSGAECVLAHHPITCHLLQFSRFSNNVISYNIIFYNIDERL